MKKGFSIILSVVLSTAMLLAGCGSSQQSSGSGSTTTPAPSSSTPEKPAEKPAEKKKEVRKFSFGYDQPPTTAYGVSGNIFQKKLEELSGATMTIDQFPGAQLGSEPQMLQKIRSGDIDFMVSSTANAASVSPQSGVFSLHYIFETEDHLAKVISDPEVNKAVKEMFAETVQGARVLTLQTMGLRNIYSKEPFAKVEDLAKKKIRVQATKTEDTHFAGYGAQTVHMPFGEVYTSIQTGVVHAAENGVNVYLANKHYEVAPVMSITQHEANNSVIWVSDKLWNSLTDEEKKWVQAAADEVGKNQPKEAFRLEHESADKLKKMGVQLADVDKSGFIEKAKPIQDQLAKELGPHAEKILKLVRDLK